MDSHLLKYRIFELLDKFEEKVLNFYIKNGPEALRKKLDLDDDELWKVVFDYLVIEKEAVKLCVRNYPDYVYSLFVQRGPDNLRKNFLIEDSFYDDIWEYVMDYIGISKGAIYEYVQEHKSEFKDLIYSGKATQIRGMLGLNQGKYDRVWNEILDLFLECVSLENFNISMYEHGLKFFSNLYNTGRKHRSLRHPRAAES